MRTILVTGGAGFVGSHLCKALAAKGFSTVAVDDLSNGRRENLSEDTELLVEDLSEHGWMESLKHRRLDAVIHCAAQASNAISFQDPQLDYRANQLATWRVLQFCQRKGIRRLLFTSSMSVYGEPGRLPTPPSEAPRPLTFYAAHKAAAESYIRLTPNIDWTIFRLYTTYGMGQNLSNVSQGLVKIFLGFVLRNQTVKIHGSGDRVRDIVHVSDVVRAIMQALPTPNSYGRCYNIGSGTTLTVSDIIRRILSEAGKMPDYPVEYGAPDIGDPHRTHADISAAMRDFGWQPEIMPDAGIKLTVRQHLEQLRSTGEYKG